MKWKLKVTISKSGHVSAEMSSEISNLFHKNVIVVIKHCQIWPISMTQLVGLTMHSNISRGDIRLISISYCMRHMHLPEISCCPQLNISHGKIINLNVLVFLKVLPTNAKNLKPQSYCGK